MNKINKKCKCECKVRKEEVSFDHYLGCPYRGSIERELRGVFLENVSPKEIDMFYCSRLAAHRWLIKCDEISYEKIYSAIEQITKDPRKMKSSGHEIKSVVLEDKIISIRLKIFARDLEDGEVCSPAEFKYIVAKAS